MTGVRLLPPPTFPFPLLLSKVFERLLLISGLRGFKVFEDFVGDVDNLRRFFTSCLSGSDNPSPNPKPIEEEEDWDGSWDDWNVLLEGVVIGLLDGDAGMDGMEVNDPFDCGDKGFGLDKNFGGSDEGNGAGKAAIIYISIISVDAMVMKDRRFPVTHVKNSLYA